jgi:hypothetical protein
VQPVCLESGNLQETPARILPSPMIPSSGQWVLSVQIRTQSLRHLQKPHNVPTGKQNGSEFVQENKFAQKSSIATARSLRGRSRPGPDSVLLWATVSVIRFVTSQQKYPAEGRDNGWPAAILHFSNLPCNSNDAPVSEESKTRSPD